MASSKTSQNVNSLESTGKTERRTPPARLRTLTVDGNTASSAYLLDALRHLANVKTARAHSLAFTLFPARTQKAAIAAVHRVLANATKCGFVKAKSHPTTQHRYYALTRAGARHLAAAQPELGPVEQTTAWLETLRKSEHREWTSMLEVSSNARVGLVGMDEFHLRGPAGDELRKHFSHVPDALTFWRDKELVVWHEVETSRRSKWTPAQQVKEEAKAQVWASKRARTLGEKGRKKESGKPITAKDLYTRPNSDTQRFKDLLKLLRHKRFIPWRFDGQPSEVECEIILVLHCATELIRAEAARNIKSAFDNEVFVMEKSVNQHYEMSYLQRSPYGTKFAVFLEPIPRSTDEVWHDTGHLPFRNAPTHLRADVQRNERFLASTASSASPKHNDQQGAK